MAYASNSNLVWKDAVSAMNLVRDCLYLVCFQTGHDALGMAINRRVSDWLGSVYTADSASTVATWWVRSSEKD